MEGFQSFDITQIEYEHIIYLNEDMEQMLTGRAYCQTDYDKEDEFVINEKMIEKILVEEILSNKKKIKLVQNSFSLLAFAYSDAKKGLRDAILP